MSGSLWERAQQTPLTWVIAIAYVTMAFLTFEDNESAAAWRLAGVMQPHLVSEGQPWRLVTHAFLHGGVLHLLLNLIALIWIGPALELAMGSLRFAALYLISATGGAVAVTLVNSPMQFVLGGSGALFGMFGAAVALHARSGRHMVAFLDQQRPRQLISLIVFNLLFGFLVPGISNAAHIGGLIAGFCLTIAFFDLGQWKARRSTQLALTVAALGLLLNSLLPVTRWDWLQRRAAECNDPVLAQELAHGAALSARADSELMDLLRATQPQVPAANRRRGG